MLKKCVTCGRLANSPHTVWADGVIIEQCSDACHRPFVGVFSPIADYHFEGYDWLEIDCKDYEHLQKLPAVIRYNERIYGRTGWNSDRNRAYYSTRQKVAYAVD